MNCCNCIIDILQNLNEYGLPVQYDFSPHIVWYESPQVPLVITPLLFLLFPESTHQAATNFLPFCPVPPWTTPGLSTPPSFRPLSLHSGIKKGKDISKEAIYLDSGSSWSCPFCCCCLAFSFTFTIFSSSIFSWAFFLFISRLTCVAEGDYKLYFEQLYRIVRSSIPFPLASQLYPAQHHSCHPWLTHFKG